MIQLVGIKAGGLYITAKNMISPIANLGSWKTYYAFGTVISVAKSAIDLARTIVVAGD